MPQWKNAAKKDLATFIKTFKTIDEEVRYYVTRFLAIRTLSITFQGLFVTPFYPYLYYNGEGVLNTNELAFSVEIF